MDEARTMVAGMIVIAGGLGLMACTDWPDIATRTFSRQQSCPMERVTPVQVEAFHQTFRRSPPADVAADEGRLAIWYGTQRTIEACINYGDVYRVSGCGVAPQLLHCAMVPTGYHASRSAPDRWPILTSYDGIALVNSGN